ncbi:MAG: hypothetical protein HY320_12235 [Armatimonadetes bacterium]|nr:hypothetical protein [Armatimonadota bacterium]
MTSRQRLLTALRGGTPDRVPVAPFGLGKVDPDTETGRELISRTDPFISVGAGGDPFLGKSVPTTTRQNDAETITLIHTPKGDLVRRHQRTAVTSATVEFPCKGAQDVERLLSLPYEPPDLDLGDFSQWRERVGEEALVMVGIGNAVCFPATMLAPEDFCLLWADAPDVMAQMTEIGARRLNTYVERLCQAGVDAFRIVGGEYVTCQLGPKAFEALITPFDTQLCQLMRRYHAVTYYHNHGPIMRWLAPIADLGVDALDPLEAPPWGDGDLREARRLIGERVCLVGNLDDMEVLEQWDAVAVKELGRRRIEEAGARGFVLGGTASGTYTERAARNFVALVDVAQEMAR